jgi:hypothetical protein
VLQRILNRKLVIAAAAVAAAAFAGGAYAATQNSASNSRQAFLDDVAKRLHVTPQQLSSALNGAFLDQLQAAVKAGRLTQAEANALAQRLKQKGSLAPAVPFGPLGPHLARPGVPGVPVPGPGFPGPAFGPGFLFGGFGGGLAGAASYLGISDLQLFQDLSSGKSLAQIAASRGKTVSGLEQAMTAATKARLDKLVANKDITAAQEKLILSRFSARLSAQVNQKGLAFRRPFLRRHLGGALVPPKAPVPGAAMPVPFPAPIA